MNLDGYVPVDARLRMALQRFPELRVVEDGYKVVSIGDATFIECVVWVFTTPDDPRPVRGTVLEPFPGKTGFTRDSEAAVGFTSALGRALGYLGFGIDRGIASVDEIRARTDPPADNVRRIQPGSAANRNREPEPPPPPAIETSEPEHDRPRRQTPTDKMVSFLERLNREHGHVITDVDIDAAKADFDLCRTFIDRLKALPKD